MAPNAVPQLITTVLSGDRTVIHLARTQHLAPPRPDEQLTLCRQRVVCQVSATTFHRLGCSECALEAVRSGVTSIADRQQATVNLPRFLTARGDQFPPASTG
jgi:hypothetical protein